MKIRKQVMTVFEPEPGTVLRVPFDVFEITNIQYRKLANGMHVLGWLTRDTDTDNPLENEDCIGVFFDLRHKLDDSEKDTLQRFKDKNMDVWLDRYEHGGTVYAVSASEQARNFPDQQWDVSHGSAVWVPSPCLEEDFQRQVIAKKIPYSELSTFAREWAVERASCCVDTYNDWLAGDCWGRTVVVFDKNDHLITFPEDASIWGLIGENNACKELVDTVARTCQSVLKNPGKETENEKQNR